MSTSDELLPPLHDSNAYPPPLDQLLALGEDAARRREWPDYLALGIGREHVPELLRIATSWLLDMEDREGAEVYAPIHAWRALGQLRAEEAAQELVTMMAGLDEHDDWAYEELPEVLGMIGRSAIPLLEPHLADTGIDEWTRIAMARALREIAEADPETRARVVPILMRELSRAEQNAAELNGFVVSNLVKLRATEAAPLIEAAFAAGRVDEFVRGDWEDVQVDLGLIPERLTPRPRLIFFPPSPAPFERPSRAASSRRARKKAAAAKKAARKARKRNARRR